MRSYLGCYTQLEEEAVNNLSRREARQTTDCEYG